MTIPVTRTKVVLPRRRGDLLSRPRLLDRLYELLEYKLILIAAPAGYGKTSLLIDFAHGSDLPVGWYALDPLDRDLPRFLAHFIAAIAQRFPDFGVRSEAALEAANPANPDLHALVAAIVNDAYDHIREHFLLVLDDYHLVNEEEGIVAFINRFVQEVDENCHLVLSSRALPNLPEMPLLVARSQVGGLDLEDLAFQPEELQSLVLNNHHTLIPDDAARELARETEGWITGLLLSAQTTWQGMAERLRVARMAGVNLYDYLAQQVLDQQPPEVRDFLQRSAYLEELDVELCQAVLGEGEWSQAIEHVLQHNLFALPVGERGDWIRYHNLFRDFLQASLEKENPTARAELLCRMGEVYAERGEWERAHAALARLGEAQAVAQLVERAGPALIKSGRIVRLAEWIDALPEPLVAGRPRLLSLRGIAAITLGKIDHGLALLDQAVAALRTGGDLIGLASALTRRSVGRRFLGRYAAALEDASVALALAEGRPELAADRAEALRASGMSLYQLGRLNEAAERFLRSLEAYQALGDRQAAALVVMELGITHVSAGRYNQALAYFHRALEDWRAMGNVPGQANLLNNLGVLYFGIGNYQQAAQALDEGLACARQVGYTRLEAYILASIGDLYADLGAASAARQAYQQARQVAHGINYRFLLFYADLAESVQAHLSGDRPAARARRESARQLAEESGSGYERSLWNLNAGRISLQEGDTGAAAEHFQAASAGFDEGGQQVEAARAHFFLAAAYFAAGEQSAAARHLAGAFERVEGLDSQHILVVSGQQAGEPAKALLQSASSPTQQAAGLLERIRQFEKEIPSLRRQLRPRASAVPFAPPQLTIHALGRSAVALDGSPVTAAEWQNQKRARELFFYLLEHPDGLTKEAIGLVIWPESSPAQLKLQFKNAIYRLRYALGPEVIAFEGDRYWFNREQDYEYDVESFREALRRARAAAGPAEKITAYREAVERYAGEYLPEASSTWVVPLREGLRQKYESALLELSRMHLEAGDPGAALDYAQRAQGEDPCLEEAYRLAMLACAARGDRAGVVRLFQRCRQALLEEMNLQPSSQTIELYEALRK